MLEPQQSTTERTPDEAWFGIWQPVEPLATAGSVVLWRVTSGDGSALLRLYPRFQREQAWRKFTSVAAQRAKLDHPRLLPLAKLGTHGRPHLLLSDPVGEPLATRIEREPLTPEVALRVFADVATALEALARAGVGPVDISPADVFLVAGDRGLLLADVGLLGEVASAQNGAAAPTFESMGQSFAAVLGAALSGPAEELPPTLAAALSQALVGGPRRRQRTPTQIVDGLRRALKRPRTTTRVARRPRVAAPVKPPPATKPAATKPRRVQPRGLAAIVGSALVAAAAGAAIGVATTASDPLAPAQIRAAGLSVEAPTGWARVRPAAAPFDAGAGALVARPAAGSPGGLAVTRSGDSLLESAAGVEPDAVALRAGDAWRYGNVRVGGRAADLYLLQTTTGPIVAACYAPTAAGREPLARCSGVVGSLRVRGADALPLGGATAIRTRVAAALGTLERQRVRGRRVLATAARRGGQAAAASELANAFAAAASATGGRETIGIPGARTRLGVELAATGRAYSALAAAARVGDAAAYLAARGQVLARERALAPAIDALAPTSAD